MSFLSLVQSINRHLAAMKGPSTGIIQNIAFGCVKDRLESKEDGERGVMLCGWMRGKEARTGKRRDENNLKYILFNFITHACITHV